MMTQTQIYGVIGDPIAHSLSPVMQNAALKALGIDAEYRAFHVLAKNLEEFFLRIRNHEISGINVTLPHKQNVIPYLDALTSEAQLVGAVNTVYWNDGKLMGHNTDAQGYTLSLQQQTKVDLKQKKILLLGAGGAARAILVGLGREKVSEISILNRTLSKAQNLIQDLQGSFLETHFQAFDYDQLDNVEWNSIDLLINSSSLGLKNSPFPDLPLSDLPPSALISDIVYNPLETTLIKKAKSLTLQTHPGWGMLLYQGALALEIWTQKKAPVDVMEKALLGALNS